MRPISLEIEGFTSFKEKVAIDFSSLDLFAITGPTGAGKTSIIDAITYALYGCTPRIGKKSARDLISQGSPRMSVLLEFSSGESQYRVARETKTTTKTVSTTVRLEERHNTEWISLADKISEADARITSIVGLDFNGFTKSVVLPQGEFDRFLKGEASQRREILNELLHLDIYKQMMKRANEIDKEHRSQAEIFEGLLTRDFAGATPERRNELLQQLDEIRPRLEPVTSALDQASKAIPRAHQLRQQRTDLSSAEKELNLLGPKRAAAESRLAEVRKAIDERQKALDVIDAKIAANDYDSGLHVRLSATREKAEQLQALKTLVEGYGKTRKTKETAVAEAESASKTAEAECDKTRTERESAEKELQSGKKRLDAATKKHGSPDAIKALLVENKRRMAEEQKMARLEAEAAALSDNRSALVRELTGIAKELAAASISLDLQKGNLESLLREHAAHDLKASLEAGQPCPVCEQPVKRVPKVKKHPSLDDGRKAVDQGQAELTRLEKRESELEARIEQLGTQSKDRASTLLELGSSIKESSKRIQAVTGTAAGVETESQLVTLRDELIELQETTDRLASRVETSRTAETRAQTAANRQEQQLRVLQTELNSISSEMERGRKQSDVLRKELGDFAELSAVNAALSKQEKSKEDLDRLSNSKSEESAGLSRAKDELVDADGTRKILATQAAEVEKRIEQLRSSTKALAKSLRSSFPEIDVEAADPELDAAAQLEDLGRSLQIESDSLKRQIQSSEQDLKRIDEQIRRSAEIRNELEQRRAEAAVARELGLALHGDRFIAFIQQEAYHRLAQDGSVHLRTLSSGRYSFDVDEDEFVALDHWNADEPRPVTTLSGGESFLASLALALALAEGLSGLSPGRGRYALESLFLDEGFGTLDAETLDVVLQGIENLSTTDRLVAIVSHIPELADRLPARINVRKTVTGSTIETS
jgi:exonuclease SbcC